MFSQLAQEFNRNPQLDDDEGFEQVPTARCPFDASHIMQPKNLITHINRCKSPNKYLYVECRYDPCHWVYMEYLQQHYEKCPTRKQYYADLDLKDGDWDEQQLLLRLQEKALREKMDKKRRKILKLMVIVRLRKKLKRASSRQQFQSIKASLIMEQSCFTRKSNKNDCNQFEVFKVRSTAKYQPKLFQNQSNVNDQTQNIPHIRPQMSSSFYSEQTVNGYKFVYAHQALFAEQNHFQYPIQQPFYQTAMHQPQYSPFIQQHPFYPKQQLRNQIYIKPHIMQYQQFYCNSDVNYSQWMKNKPLPERSLMFSSTTNTYDFIKKTYYDKNKNIEQKLKKIPFISDQCFQKEEYPKNNKSKKSKKQQDKKSKKKSNEQGSKKQDKKSKQNNVKGARKKTEKEYQLKALENQLDLSSPKNILDSEITEYDFIPFDLYQDLTIRKQSPYQTDDIEERSNFLEMKEMLQILEHNQKG